MPDPVFRRVDEICARYSRLMDEGIMPDDENSEYRELQNLGFKRAEVAPDGDLATEVMKAFQRHVPCASLSRVSDDDTRFDFRLYAPIQYRLDHSVAIRNGLVAAQAAFRRLAKGFRGTVTYEREAIHLTFEKKRK